MNIIKALPILAASLLAASLGHAALTPIGPLGFPSGATVIDFSGLATGTDANGLTVDGALFQVIKNGSPASGIVIVDAGPGITGHISPPNLVTIADVNGVALIVSLPNLMTQFGYGYALQVETSVPAATTIELFAGATSLGSISFTATPDPTFAGGFAGVASDTPFDRAILTFSNLGDAFAVDNVTFARTVVSDEAPTIFLLSVGIFALLCLGARHRVHFASGCGRAL